MVLNDNVPEIGKSIQGLASLIGNTPLFEIEFLNKGKPGKIYAKAEHLNMTGSIKDRMALHIIREAYRKNLIKPGDRIVEATSGNTGIAFSAVGRALGHRPRDAQHIGGLDVLQYTLGCRRHDAIAQLEGSSLDKAYCNPVERRLELVACR